MHNKLLAIPFSLLLSSTSSHKYNVLIIGLFKQYSMLNYDWWLDLKQQYFFFTTSIFYLFYLFITTYTYTNNKAKFAVTCKKCIVLPTKKTIRFSNVVYSVYTGISNVLAQFLSDISDIRLFKTKQSPHNLLTPASKLIRKKQQYNFPTLPQGWVPRDHQFTPLCTLQLPQLWENNGIIFTSNASKFTRLMS